ncbi:MAG: GTPase [Bilophila wadsworthia]
MSVSPRSEELDGLRQQRAFTRARRARQGLPVAALVGYTNAGKSTLLNALTRSEVLAEDKLFATLDPTTRRLRFPEEHELVLADTVGFIRNLPKELTEAFQATLEELEAADLLLHVVDASHPELDRQIAAVDGILADMELNEFRVLILNNPAEDEMRDILRDRWPDARHFGGNLTASTCFRCIENTIHWETTANIEITGPCPKCTDKPPYSGKCHAFLPRADITAHEKHAPHGQGNPLDPVARFLWCRPTATTAYEEKSTEKPHPDKHGTAPQSI